MLPRPSSGRFAPVAGITTFVVPSGPRDSVDADIVVEALSATRVREGGDWLQLEEHRE